MKILFTESSPDIGGQELQALAQMTALQKQGHSVLLACREKSKIAHEARTIGHDVTSFQEQSSPSFHHQTAAGNPVIQT
ncbi:hypothetical protein KJH77_001474 [Escherichia coli]|nr:hypothetical protein [Escherichia coli]